MTRFDRKSLVLASIPTFFVVIFVIAVGLFLSRASTENRLITLKAETAAAADDTEQSLQRLNLVLEGMRSLWLASDEVTKEEFIAYAKGIYPSLNGVAALQWVDADHVVRYVYPLEGENLKVVDFDNKPYPNRLEPIEQAMATGRMVTTRPIILVQGYPGMVAFLPINKNGEHIGTVVAVKSMASVFRHAAQHLRDYAAVVRIDDRILPIDGATLYTSDGLRIVDPAGNTAPDGVPERLLRPDKNAVSVTFDAGTHAWTIAASLTTYEPDLALKAHLVLGSLFVVVTFVFLLFLADRQRKLRELAVREKDFSSLVSHQLRAPLTELSWMTDTALETASSPEQKDILIDMRVIVGQCVKLVASLLDLSKVERGVLKLRAESVPVAAIVDDVVRPLKEAAAAKKARFAIDVPADLDARVDSVKAVEAVRNIVDNAIKYGPPGQTVTITAGTAPEGGAVILKIGDQGPGIPADIRDRIFEKASVYAKKGTTSGAGLGLYLTKMFLEAMGGSVGFETSAKGTTFVVTLPAKK